MLQGIGAAKGWFLPPLVGEVARRRRDDGGKPRTPSPSLAFGYSPCSKAARGETTLRLSTFRVVRHPVKKVAFCVQQKTEGLVPNPKAAPAHTSLFKIHIFNWNQSVSKHIYSNTTLF